MYLFRQFCLHAITYTMISLALFLLGFAPISQCCVVPYTRNPFKNEDYCKEILPGENPYQISVETVQNDLFEHLCSGALITFEFVITAAHCIFNYTPSQLYVFAGLVNLKDSVFYSIVKNISIPDSYTFSEPCHNDIALLALLEKFNPSINVGTVLLPSVFSLQNEFLIGHSLATVSGYERLAEHTNLTHPRMYGQLVKTDNYIVSHRLCNMHHGGLEECLSIDTQLCTDWRQTNRSIRDPGAPLVYRETLLGIASCARGCYHPDSANVFTNVTKYVTWIVKIISWQSVHLSTIQKLQLYFIGALHFLF